MALFIGLAAMGAMAYGAPEVGGCIGATMGICVALCGAIIAATAFLLQIVQISYAWRYAFPADATESAADPL
mgnify:CR=1 FL=1